MRLKGFKIFLELVWVRLWILVCEILNFHWFCSLNFTALCKNSQYFRTRRAARRSLVVVGAVPLGGDQLQWTTVFSVGQHSYWSSQSVLARNGDWRYVCVFYYVNLFIYFVFRGVFSVRFENSCKILVKINKMQHLLLFLFVLQHCFWFI